MEVRELVIAGWTGRDEQSLRKHIRELEALGVKPRLVQGSPANIKVTYPEDIALVEAILAGRARAV